MMPQEAPKGPTRLLSLQVHCRLLLHVRLHGRLQQRAQAPECVRSTRDRDCGSAEERWHEDPCRGILMGRSSADRLDPPQRARSTTRRSSLLDIRTSAKAPATCPAGQRSMPAPGAFQHTGFYMPRRVALCQGRKRTVAHPGCHRIKTHPDRFDASVVLGCAWANAAHHRGPMPSSPTER